MKEHDDLRDQARLARTYALTMIYHAGSGHPGGAMSAIDLLCYLYFQEMNVDPKDPAKPDRDRFVLSKGHACAALYAVGYLAGFLTRGQLAGFRQLSSELQGHPHVGATPFVETSTGSLGQGFSVALGMALGLRHKQIDARTYVMIGDGEVQEGEIWEGAMFAAHHKLNGLCAILDYNKLQSDNLNAKIMNLEPLADKWRAFGWHVIEIDGHRFHEMAEAFDAFSEEEERPTLILAHTLKGKDIYYMENDPNWHGSVTMNTNQLVNALVDLRQDAPFVERCLRGTIWEEADD